MLLVWGRPITYNSVYSFCKVKCAHLRVRWTLELVDHDYPQLLAKGTGNVAQATCATSGIDEPRAMDTSVPQAVASPAPGMVSFLQSFKLAQMVKFGALVCFEELYDLQEKLGEGTFGLVHKAVRRADLCIVAVKTAKHADDFIEFTAEAMLLGLFHHPNVLRLLDVHANANTVRLVLPFHGDTLGSAIHSDMSLQIPCITRQISDALHYVHAMGLVHNDVKPANILFEPSKGGLVVLGDFGHAFMQGVHRKPLKEIMARGLQQGTLPYRAPEILLGDAAYGQPADMWATGCVLGELVARRPMFAANGALPTLMAILKLLGSPVAKDLDIFAGFPHWSPQFPAFRQGDWWQVWAHELGDAGVARHERDRMLGQTIPKVPLVYNGTISLALAASQPMSGPTYMHLSEWFGGARTRLWVWADNVGRWTCGEG